MGCGVGWVGWGGLGFIMAPTLMVEVVEEVVEKVVMEVVGVAMKKERAVQAEAGRVYKKLVLLQNLEVVFNS